jgi:ubiquinone/menaquinone biosynthesis C-methylase UbiE
LFIGEDAVASERRRIISEYRRRQREIPAGLYAPYSAAEIFMQTGRKRRAAALLRRAGLFPDADCQCLEVGFGSLGWLGDLINWRVRETSLHGIELDRERAERAIEILPKADLRIGDAATLPWANDSFQLVIASTVFTSILNTQVRHLVADEITRVLSPGGALLWYDFAVNNPRNSNVRKVDRKELGELFPLLKGSIKSLTLAPFLSRLLAPKAWPLAVLLEAVPLLHTHLMAVLVKEQTPGIRLI